VAAVTASEIRERVNLTEADVPDDVALRFAKTAALTVGLELEKTVDYADCADEEAEAIRNIAAVYCKCKTTGGSFSGLNFRLGDLAVDESSQEEMQFLMGEAQRILDGLKQVYVGSA
jgi:hypothetical protein